MNRTVSYQTSKETEKSRYRLRRDIHVISKYDIKVFFFKVVARKPITSHYMYSRDIIKGFRLCGKAPSLLVS